jgi:ankyrin repeat protein
MKRILIISALTFLLCSSLAYGENPLPSGGFWKTATVEDVNSAVASGADVNARDEYGQTALMTAARFNPSPEIVNQLVKLGADVNAEKGQDAFFIISGP